MMSSSLDGEREDRSKQTYIQNFCQLQTISQTSELKILFLDRGAGREIYMAVINDSPVAYCVGYREVRGTTSRFRISVTYVWRSHRRQGIAQQIYLTILNQGRVLISDFEISNGAKSLWCKLSKMDILKIRSTGKQFVAIQKSKKVKDSL